ncbi:MAG: serine acetyltransferase [Candidatus Margulisiibacteriota bacterium]
MNYAKTLTQQQAIIASILASYQSIGGINHLDGTSLPSRQSISVILSKIKQLLFPGFFEELCLQPHNITQVVGERVYDVVDHLAGEVYKSMLFEQKKRPSAKTVSALRKDAMAMALAFMSQIPDLRLMLKGDAQATFEGDPAAYSEPEILLCYPGFQATTVYRIAHFFYALGLRLIPRMMTEICHSETGIDIHPGATIGHHFCIDHGTGLVIGETAVLGHHVKLYQGVTIGALSVPKRNVRTKRHPTLEDHVIVYARTTILGGDTVIGKESVIGGNVWLTQSVPPHSKIYLTHDLKQKIKRGSDLGT